MTQPKYTNQQLTLIQELCFMHGLQPDQISFEGQDPAPIFDYEAVCSLSLKLTDIADIAAEIQPIDPMRHLESKASCRVVLADGRSRTVEDSAEIGERLGNGVTIETKREADGVAQNRSVRRGIRSVGVNLYNAHRKFAETGEIVSGSTKHDPRLPVYREIHVLATELDLIVDGDRTGYRLMMAEMFEGINSSKLLNDIQLHQFLVGLRAMAGAKRYKGSNAA